MWVLLGLSVSGFVTMPPTSPEIGLLSVSPWPRVGLASWYSEQDPGIHRATASGERFADDAFTAAMWSIPFDSCVRVTNLKTFEQVTVRVNDRGPHQRLLLQGRLIDLSRAAFAKLADLDEGLIPVELELLASPACAGIDSLGPAR